VLRHEWGNARGCIARFERMAIEIRLLDLQECPRADIAIAAAVVGALRELVAESWSSLEVQQSFSAERLLPLLMATVREADATSITDDGYLAALGYPGQGPVPVSRLWRHLVESVAKTQPGFGEWQPALDVILDQGCLARRILRATGAAPSRERLHAVYGELASCLARGEMFNGG
jgi:carboxylate-amine ligase